MTLNIVLIDLTTDATPEALKPTPDRFMALMQAWIEQVQGPYAAAYGAPSLTMRNASSPEDRASGEIAINFRDTIPEAPGALAYHQVIGGVPDIELGVDLFSSWADSLDSESVSVGGTHELLEMLQDLGANEWADIQDPLNRTRAHEICDRVQNTCYSACNGYPVSNFVLPSFFIPGAIAPFDQMGVLTNQDPPTPGDTFGYEIIGDSPNNVAQVSGSKGLTLRPGKRMLYVLGSLSTLQHKRRRSGYSRTHRRGIRL